MEKICKRERARVIYVVSREAMNRANTDITALSDDITLGFSMSFDEHVTMFM